MRRWSDIKIKITYQTDEELNEVLRILSPYINAGAKLHKTDRYKPYKHAYMTITKPAKHSGRAENA